MKWKNNTWRYATAFVVTLILLNPEMADLALFIDAAGLDLILLLLEVQILAISGALLNTFVNPCFKKIKRLFEAVLFLMHGTPSITNHQAVYYSCPARQH